MSTMNNREKTHIEGAKFADVLSKEDFEFLDEVPSLYKASSVPHLNSKSEIGLGNRVVRKKTSEASPLPDPLLFAQLRHEKQLLQDRLIKEEEERKQIVGINHQWDVQYNNLNQKFLMLEQEHKKLQEDAALKDKELAKKEKQVMKLTKKIEMLIINSCEQDSDKPMSPKDECDQVYGASSMIYGSVQHFDEDVFETLRKTEMLMSEERDGRKEALHQLQEMKIKCDYLENVLSQKNHERTYLQNELKRLSTALELKTATSENKKFINFEESPNVNAGRGFGNRTGGDDNIELLKQQLQVYAEDFNAEKSEKQKLLAENQDLKEKFNVFMEEKNNLIKQLQIYEEDFQREREKRINLMRSRMTSSGANPLSTPSVNPSSSTSAPRQDDAQTWKEYCCLVVEREQISDRINDLESQGVVRYNGRSSNTNQPYQNQLPRGRSIPSQSFRHAGSSSGGDFYQGAIKDSRHPWTDEMYMGVNNARSNGGKLYPPRRSVSPGLSRFEDEF